MKMKKKKKMKMKRELKVNKSRWMEEEQEMGELENELFGHGRNRTRDRDGENAEEKMKEKGEKGDGGGFGAHIDEALAAARKKKRAARGEEDSDDANDEDNLEDHGVDDLGLFVVEDRTGNTDLAKSFNDDDDDDDDDDDRKKKKKKGDDEDAAVWVDNDDATLEVDIATGAGRLRKLRTKSEDRVVSGREYERRLRAQHASMHPRTTWANVVDDDDNDDDGSQGTRVAEDAEDRENTLDAVVHESTRKRKKGESDASFIARQHFESGSAALASSVERGGGVGGAIAGRLAPGIVGVQRLRDANAAEPSAAVIQSVGFHPFVHGLMFTAGFDRKLRYFQVDGRQNPLVQGVHFEDMPLHTAAFVDAGRSVLCAGRRQFLYMHHLEAGEVERIAGIAGRDEKSFESFVASSDANLGGAEPLVAFLGEAGCVPLFSLRSRQAAGTLRMSGTVRCAAFCNGGRNLMTAGGDGAVCLWDLRMRRCLDRRRDEGTLTCTALDCGTGLDGSFYACGSDVGSVNVYQSPPPPSSSSSFFLAKEPRRSLMNLTTSVDTLSFSRDCQMLAMASRMKKESFRLVHLPSCTVFSNWPTASTPLHYVHCAAFSANSELLAIGNAKGKVLLYSLDHYTASPASMPRGASRKRIGYGRR